MTDDFFSNLTSYEDGTGEVPPHLLLSTVQYAIRTNLRVVGTLVSEEALGGMALIPSQLTQIVKEAYRSYEATHRHDGTDVPARLLDTVRPVDLYARGILHGMELSLCPESRTAKSVEHECCETFSSRPLRREEQARLQRLIDAAGDERGWEDRTLRRLVAFSVIKMFILSDRDGRRLPDAYWSAFVGGVMDGMDKARAKEIVVRSIKQRNADGEMRTARDNDVAQSTVMVAKRSILPPDEDSGFAWALSACERARKSGECSPEQGHAIKCMSRAYALPLAMATARIVFDLACEGDGMSEGEVIRRLASAMYDYASGWSQGVAWQTKAIVQFDMTKGMSADLIAVVLYGIYWVCGYASEMIGWMWEPRKAHRHQDAMFGDERGWGCYSTSRVPHVGNMRDGYKHGWGAGERGRIRIHRLTTTTKLRALEDAFMAKVAPVIDGFESLSYAALFLYIPAATPSMPLLLP